MSRISFTRTGDSVVLNGESATVTTVDKIGGREVVVTIAVPTFVAAEGDRAILTTTPRTFRAAMLENRLTVTRRAGAFHVGDAIEDYGIVRKIELGAVMTRIVCDFGTLDVDSSRHLTLA